MLQGPLSPRLHGPGRPSGTGTGTPPGDTPLSLSATRTPSGSCSTWEPRSAFQPPPSTGLTHQPPPKPTSGLSPLKELQTLRWYLLSKNYKPSAGLSSQRPTNPCSLDCSVTESCKRWEVMTATLYKRVDYRHSEWTESDGKLHQLTEDGR